MCLFNAKKIEQEGEVTCYKILIRFDFDYNDVYRSPFCIGTSWKVGETKTAFFKQLFPCPTVVNKDGSVESGAFHTFKTWDDAVKYSGWFAGKLFIAECVIPEDNEYLYEGDVIYDEGRCSLYGYASQKLKVVSVTPVSVWDL